MQRHKQELICRKTLFRAIVGAVVVAVAVIIIVIIIITLHSVICMLCRRLFARIEAIGCKSAKTNYPWNWTRQISLRCFIFFFRFYFAHTYFAGEAYLLIPYEIWITFTLVNRLAVRAHMNTYAYTHIQTPAQCIRFLFIFCFLLEIVDTEAHSAHHPHTEYSMYSYSVYMKQHTCADIHR